MIYAGGAALIAGIVWTLLLAGRWAERFPSAGGAALFRAAASISVPFGLGWVLAMGSLAVSVDGFADVVTLGIAIGGFVAMYVITALVYIPFFQWAARARAQRAGSDGNPTA